MIYSIENLDMVLRSFQKFVDNPLSFPEIKAGLEYEITDQELDAAILKLEKDEYLLMKAETEVDTKIVVGKRYYLSFDGELFLESSLRRYKNRPYRSSLIKSKRQQSWTITKIVANIANAILIISIAFWGVWVQTQNNIKDKKTVIIKAPKAAIHSADTTGR